MKKDKLKISKDVSNHLFLSNLKPDNSNDDKIKNLILSLTKVVKNNKSDKLAYLNTLEYRLRHVRYRNIITGIEKEKEIKNMVIE